MFNKIYGKFSKNEYEKHLTYEKKYYNQNLYTENLIEKSTPAFEYLLNSYKNKIKAKTGLTVGEHLISEVNKKGQHYNPVKILSVGSGPGGTEIINAKKFTVNFKFDCIDINEKSLSIGQKKANDEQLNFDFIQQDINEIKLPAEEYDVVFSLSALHHMINHEHIADEIKKTMKSDAVFIIQEPIPRNGFRMWDETKIIANKLWSQLPDKYKIDCIDKRNKTQFLDELPDMDLSVDGFECVRSQDLYKILKEKFRVIFEVPGFSFARRFMDKRFGCNYDLNNPFDKAVLDIIIKLDETYSKLNNLKPESIVFVLKK